MIWLWRQIDDGVFVVPQIVANGHLNFLLFFNHFASMYISEMAFSTTLRSLLAHYIGHHVLANRCNEIFKGRPSRRDEPKACDRVGI